MRHWKGGDAVNCLNQYKHSPSWCEKECNVVFGAEIVTGRKSKAGVLVMDIHDEIKSLPCTSIHYTYNETLERLRCWEWPESVQTYSILVQK